MNRLAKSAIALKEQSAGDDLAPREQVALNQSSLRVQQRTDTLGVVLYAVARVVLWGIAALLVLGELGVNLAPLVAGAGVLGVALGFGAQKVVQDFLSGMFMIAEDQFGVGDVIDLGDAKGTVEKITLRTTVLRDVYGTVWHVPNGEVRRVGNMSQRWSKALLDIGVAYNTDTDQASAVLLDTATELAHEPQWSDAFLDDPEVLGVESLAADAITIRIAVKTRPAKQWDVQRELNRRFKLALDEAGIEIPFPQRTVWIRHDDAPTDVPSTGAPAGDAPAGDVTGPL
jgi:small conductance mechanosensitive channel